MKITVIPDIHNKVSKASHIFTKEADSDKVIFLGDYFDARGDGGFEAQKVAEWLRRHINNPKFVFLYGNHDIGYAFPNTQAQCSGHSFGKYIAANEVLRREHWDKLKFFWFAGGWFFCHGGLHPSYIPKNVKTIPEIKEWLLFEEKEARHRLIHTDQDHWFYRYGFSRTDEPISHPGGLLWCDANDEFQPVEGLAQVFGHTHQRSLPPKFIKDNHLNIIQNEKVLNMELRPADGYNVCLDTGLNHYAVITDGVLKIKTI